MSAGLRLSTSNIGGSSARLLDLSDWRCGDAFGDQRGHRVGKLEDDLRELAALRESELLTEDEYQSKRAELIRGADLIERPPTHAQAVQPRPSGVIPRLWSSPWWAKALIAVVVVFVVLSVVGAIVGSGDDEATPSLESSDTTDGSGATNEDPLPTSGPPATPTTAPPTATPIPPTPVPSPVSLAGFGQFVSEPFLPPAAASRVVLTHNGSSNFIVWAYGDEQQLLVNTIGAYSGSRPLISEGSWFLEIDADGAWTASVEAIPFDSGAAGGISGTGDVASGLFEPLETGPAPVEISHNGGSNFIVWLHCGGGSELVQNEIGSLSGSTVVDFPAGPCLWDVQSEGSWSLVLR
jgi:hypothetical protein